MSESPLLETAAAPARAVDSWLRDAPKVRRGLEWASWLFPAILVILVGWDIALDRDQRDLNTWSEVARAASFELPILPWFLGSMVGHLFHGRRTPSVLRDAGATLMGILFATIALWTVVLRLDGGTVSVTTVAGLALAGVVISYLAWPLQRDVEWRW